MMIHDLVDHDLVFELEPIGGARCGCFWEEPIAIGCFLGSKGRRPTGQGIAIPAEIEVSDDNLLPVGVGDQVHSGDETTVTIPVATLLANLRDAPS